MIYNSSYHDYERKCLAHMASNGIIFSGSLQADGKLHRFSMDQKKNKPDEWYIAWQFIGRTNVPGIYCNYGTWSGGYQKFTFISWKQDNQIDEQERQYLEETMRAKREENAAQLEKDRLARLKMAQDAWEQAEIEPTKTDHTTYLKHKQVKAHGVRFGQDNYRNNVLIIPLRNITGEIQAIQYIKENGEKRIHGLKKGNFHLIGEINDFSVIRVTEGYSTGSTIHEVSNIPVVIAIDCHNLDSVVGALRETYPKNSIIICGDDDVEVDKNPGRSKAEEVAKKYQCKVMFPVFPSDFKLPNGKRPTDFNDLHIHFGVDEVIAQINQTQQESQKKSDGSLVPDEVKEQSNGLQFRSAYSLIQEPPKTNWLIKSYLDAGSLSVLFGEPGSMKSFLAIDMGYCIATGRKWHGMPIRKAGAVFYIAGEGFAGLSKRLRAWSLANDVNLKDVPFFVSDRPAQLLNPNSSKEVIQAIEELKHQYGQPVFVIIDTLNRNFGPGDENKTEDMTAFVNCIDFAIRIRYGCAVLIVHLPLLMILEEQEELLLCEVHLIGNTL